MGPNCYRVQLLAPPQGRTVSGTRISVEPERYAHYLSSLQRLRAQSYLEDGAIESWQIDEQGRFHMEGDEESWHFLLLDAQQNTVACLRLLLHSNTATFDQLRLTHSAIAKDPLWKAKVRAAVEADLAEAREARLGYAELGGWAIAPEHRCTKAAVETLLASYAWGQMVGGCLSSCTATVRHRSAMILRRIGGQSLEINGEPIPPYMDPQYGCQMEILRFDSRVISRRFFSLVEEMRARMETSTIIRASDSPSEDFSAELSFRQSLLALGTATRQSTIQFDPSTASPVTDTISLH